MRMIGERDLGIDGACTGCLRRSWLLSMVSPQLEYFSRRGERLLELLALDDGELLAAVGGRRRAELTARYEQFDRGSISQGEGTQAICHHDARYPRALSHVGAPRLLNVSGPTKRLGALTAAPVVAIIGSTRATDYGMEMAKSLARGLAACGVTIASGLGDGIAVAAHAGALEVQAGTVTVLAGGLDVACPAKRRSLYERLGKAGCALSELPRDCRTRRWGRLASERIVAGLATLTVVVEAAETPADLACARIAQALDRTVAAVPGRVTSPASTGTNALLMEGAQLVRGPRDALELLYPTCGPTTQARTTQAPDKLERRLQKMLELVGAGRDTPDKLAGQGVDGPDALLALSELELMGLLERGDGGRYVPRDALANYASRPYLLGNIDEYCL